MTRMHTMVAMTGDAPTAQPLPQVADVLAQAQALIAPLRNQQKLLEIRALTHPPEVVALIGTLEEDLVSLGEMLEGDQTELSQLRSLAETSALINSTLDLDQVLAGSIDEILLLTGAERGFLLLLNQAKQQLEFRVARRRDQTPEAGEEVSHTILNEVMRSRQPLLTDNAIKDPRMEKSETVAKFTLRSVLCVPLFNKQGEIIGAVYVDNRFKEGVFTERELNLLTAFANQAAIAIENALLYQQVQDSIAENTRLKELIENIFASIASGVITTSADDLILTFNRAAEEILATPQTKALNHPLHDVLPGITEDIDRQLDRVFRENERVTLESKPSIPGRGVAVLNMKLSPLKDAQQNTQGVAIVVDDLTIQREREQMLDLAGRYLPPGLVENIEAIAALSLGGQRRDMTCAFIYSCPYTPFPSDRPQEMMERLNVYLTVATQAIHKAGGIIDKYMGNEIMVLFNSQLNPQDDHAVRALQMALDMRDAFAVLYSREGLPPDQHYYRVGIHSGVATMGNVGSINRRNFTAIGDSINLAKRLQENAQNGQIIISEDTKAQAAHATGIRFVELGEIQVKGREQLTPIFEIFRANA